MGEADSDGGSVTPAEPPDSRREKAGSESVSPQPAPAPAPDGAVEVGAAPCPCTCWSPCCFCFSCMRFMVQVEVAAEVVEEGEAEAVLPPEGVRSSPAPTADDATAAAVDDSSAPSAGPAPPAAPWVVSSS
jgi:hypothetical protein